MTSFTHDSPREPFQFTARADWQNGQQQTDVSFNVPARKRLVFENVSALLETVIGQEITSVQIKTTVNGVDAWHNVFVPRTATFETRQVYSGGQRVRVYADAGTTVHVLVAKNNAACAAPCGTTMVCLSGYLLAADSDRLEP